MTGQYTYSIYAQRQTNYRMLTDACVSNTYNITTLTVGYELNLFLYETIPIQSQATFKLLHHHNGAKQTFQ